MGDKIALALSERTVYGKKVKTLRAEGLIPAVVYGPGIEPINVQVDTGIMLKTYKLAGTHAPVHLAIGGKKKIAMIKDVDFDPVRGEIRHVSFHAVNANEPVVAEVPVVLDGEGESEAEKNGLIVLQTLEKIEVKALPMDLPEAVKVDIRALAEPGDKVTLADAKLPEDVEFIDHESGHGDEDDEKPQVTDLQVASVWEPAALQAANEASAGDAEDESSVEAENGGEGDQGSQSEEAMPGGKAQDEPKQSNVDANK